MSSLRNEIIESQKVRSELLKWKLVIVSALGAAGLGFTKNAGPESGAYLVLLLIPAVCFYVDLLCRHLTLRMKVIGAFFRVLGCGEDAAYEEFIPLTFKLDGGKRNAFQLEDWALEYSTYVLSLVVAVGGFVLLATNNAQDAEKGAGCMSLLIKCAPYMFVISGLAGFCLTLYIKHVYKRMFHFLGDIGESHDSKLVEKLREIRDRGVPTNPAGVTG